MDLDFLVSQLVQRLSLSVEMLNGSSIHKLIESVPEAQREQFLNTAVAQLGQNASFANRRHVPGYVYVCFQGLLAITDGFVSQIQELLNLPPTVLYGTNLRDLSNVPVNMQGEFLFRLRNMSPASIDKCQKEAAYLQGCIKRINLELSGQSSSQMPPDADPEATDFLVQVQQVLGIPEEGFDDFNKRELLKTTPQERTPFIAHVRAHLKESPSFKANRQKPKYVYGCLRNARQEAQSMATRRLNFDAAANQLGPARPQFQQYAGIQSEDSEVGAMALEQQIPSRGQGGVSWVDPEFDAEVVGSDEVGGGMPTVVVGRPSAAMEEDVQMGEASAAVSGIQASTAPYALLFAVQSKGLGCALEEDAVQYLLASVPQNTHIFRIERLVTCLWDAAIAQGSPLSRQHIQGKCEELINVALPAHESVNDSDAMLKERKSFVQYTAHLTREQGEFRLSPVVFGTERVCNRVLRHFWPYRDRFLAVHADRSTRHQLGELLLAEDGVLICGRRFHFLYEHDERVHLFAPLSSREAGDAPRAMRSCAALADWIGNFRGVRVSKRSDRISMAFTPTLFLLSLRPDQVRVFADVMSPDGAYCFTDGCGTYGTDIQALLRERFHPHGPEGIDGSLVCAVQMRLGSAKGMLVFDPRSEGVMVHESMIKFECARLELEIVEVNCTAHARREGSRPSDMRLNVEVIQQLEHGGVPLAAMEEVLEGLLTKLGAVFESDSAAALHEVLRSRLICDAHVPASPINTALAGGLDFRLYPLRNWIEAKLNQDCVEKLKELKIPIELGASNLFGVTMRESGLGPRQVFLRLSPSQPPMQGTVVIGRHPCNHPGDLQVLEAVSSPELEQRLGHLHGVVVFPLTGDRPLQDMMGGGDLDGDTFWVIWDPRLIPPRREQALDYGQYTPKGFGAASLGLDGPVEAGGMTAFDLREAVRHFVHSESSVGQLTNLRKLAADRFGCKDPRTLQLCGLVSKALDAKTSGENVRVPADLRAEVERAGWPCWWAKGESQHEYAPEAGMLKAAAALHRRVASFSFGAAPIQHDAQLWFLVGGETEFDRAEFSSATGIIDEYYARKASMVQTKNTASGWASALVQRRSLLEKRKRGSAPAESAGLGAFGELDSMATAVFLNFAHLPPGQPVTAEHLKRRAAAWYRASFERRRPHAGRQPASTLLQIPQILHYLVQLKAEASVAETLRLRLGARPGLGQGLGGRESGSHNAGLAASQSRSVGPPLLLAVPSDVAVHYVHHDRNRDTSAAAP